MNGCHRYIARLKFLEHLHVHVVLMKRDLRHDMGWVLTSCFCDQVRVAVRALTSSEDNGLVRCNTPETGHGQTWSHLAPFFAHQRQCPCYDPFAAATSWEDMITFVAVHCSWARLASLWPPNGCLFMPRRSASMHIACLIVFPLLSQHRQLTSCILGCHALGFIANRDTVLIEARHTLA